MATFFVVVTFDLDNANSAGYACAEKNLNAIGLSKSLTSNAGSTVSLPHNTFAGKFNGKDAASVRDHVYSEAEAALKKCNLSGSLFVSVGDNWTWVSNTF